MTLHPRYLVKCNDCKRIIKETDDVRESYQGGRCEQCRLYAEGYAAGLKSAGGVYVSGPQAYVAGFLSAAKRSPQL